MRAPSKDLTIREGRSVFLYNEKSPYVRSGKGEHGALRLDTDADKCMCHECGRYFEDLARHVRSHGLVAREYKLKHGLPLRTALVNEKIRLRIIATTQARLAVPGARERSMAALKRGREGRYARNGSKGRAKRQNFKSHCRAQIVERIAVLAQRLGHTPSFREIREEHGYSRDLIDFRFGSVRGLQRAANLVPNKKCHEGQGVFNHRYSDEMLSHMLQLFARVHGRVPTSSDCKRGYLPDAGTFFRRFGTWSKALRSAGLFARRKAA